MLALQQALFTVSCALAKDLQEADAGGHLQQEPKQLLELLEIASAHAPCAEPHTSWLCRIIKVKEAGNAQPGHLQQMLAQAQAAAQAAAGDLS